MIKRDNFGKPPPMAENILLLFVQNVRSLKTPSSLEQTHCKMETSMNILCRKIRIRSSAIALIAPTQVVTFVNFVVKKYVYKA